MHHEALDGRRIIAPRRFTTHCAGQSIQDIGIYVCASDEAVSRPVPAIRHAFPAIENSDQPDGVPAMRNEGVERLPPGIGPGLAAEQFNGEDTGQIFAKPQAGRDHGADPLGERNGLVIEIYFCDFDHAAQDARRISRIRCRSDGHKQPCDIMGVETVTRDNPCPAQA